MLHYSTYIAHLFGGIRECISSLGSHPGQKRIVKEQILEEESYIGSTDLSKKSLVPMGQNWFFHTVSEEGWDVRNSVGSTYILSLHLTALTNIFLSEGCGYLLLLTYYLLLS